MAVFMLIVACLCILFAVFWYKQHQKYSQLPPGPKPLPLLGNSHQVKAERLNQDITEIGKTYGDIFTFHFLTRPTVILNSVSVIREVLSSPEYADVFSGRDVPFFSKNILPNDLFANSNMEEVQVLRKLFMRGIKQYGTHLKNVEHHAQVELGTLIGHLNKMDGESVDPAELINQYTANVIMILIAGQRFHPSHEALRIVAEVASDFDYITNFMRMFLLETVPFSQTVFPAWGKRCQRIRQNKIYLAETITNIVKESGDPLTSCLFSFLQDEVIEGNITEESKNGLLMDTIQTGVLTTKPTILVILAELALHPEIQERVQEEMDKVVGRDRLPCLDDKQNLPYTQAVMFEVFRLFTPVALPGPRATIKDCTYKGYFIPRGTQATYNVWHVNHDESFWEDPFKFDPSRFLDQDGNVLPPEHEKRQRLLTFGLGKRSCVGELVLARVRIFLAVSAILQNFDLKRDPELLFPSSDPRDYSYGFITTPPPYKLCFVPRG